MVQQYRYTVIIEPADEGGYLARVPALDDLTTQGETLEEVEYMAQAAIKCHIEALKDQNLPIPQDFFKEKPQVQMMAVTV
jgi:antitoxin HicB